MVHGEGSPISFVNYFGLFILLNISETPIAIHGLSIANIEIIITTLSYSPIKFIIKNMKLMKKSMPKINKTLCNLITSYQIIGMHGDGFPESLIYRLIYDNRPRESIIFLTACSTNLPR